MLMSRHSAGGYKRQTHNIAKRGSAPSATSGAPVQKPVGVGGKTPTEKGKKKLLRVPPRVGVLAPEDPFFWFCTQNYALYTYPASQIPRHFLNDGSSLVYKYADFVSRTGTPEPRASIGTTPSHSTTHPHSIMQARNSVSSSKCSFHVSSENLEAENNVAAGSLAKKSEVPVPPSICLCQPTEITTHVRQRWEVRKEYIDDRKLILGDTGWFPGALGQKFTFEVKSDKVDRYVSLSDVPQAQLLYVEHLKIPREKKAKKTRMAREPKDPFETDGESSSASNVSREASPTTRAPGKGSKTGKQRAGGRRERTAIGPTATMKGEQTANLILPLLV